MSAPTKEACPVTGHGIALLNRPFEQVAGTFSGFTSAGERGPGELRGGNRRDGKKPRIHSRRAGFQADNSRYHIESSFTPDQLPYVGLTVAGLNKLARGETLFQQTQVLPTLSDFIHARFLAPTDTRLQFGRSVAESTVSLLNRFISLYPNLTPALEAITREAGTDGTLEAISASQDLLQDALAGKRGYEEDIYLSPKSSVNKFTGEHFTPDYRGQFEIWCSGEAFGKTIIRQARDAASRLAVVPGVRENYDPLEMWYDPEYYRGQIQKLTQYTPAAV